MTRENGKATIGSPGGRKEKMNENSSCKRVKKQVYNANGKDTEEQENKRRLQKVQRGEKKEEARVSSAATVLRLLLIHVVWGPSARYTDWYSGSRQGKVPTRCCTQAMRQFPIHTFRRNMK